MEKELENLIVEYQKHVRKGNAYLKKIFNIETSPLNAKHEGVIPLEGCKQFGDELFSWFFRRRGGNCRFRFNATIVDFEYDLNNGNEGFDSSHLYDFVLSNPSAVLELRDRDTYDRALVRLCERGSILKRFVRTHAPDDSKTYNIRYYYPPNDTEEAELESLIIAYEQYVRNGNAYLQQLFSLECSPYLGQLQDCVPRRGARKIKDVDFIWSFHRGGCSFYFNSIFARFEYAKNGDAYAYTSFDMHNLHRFIASLPSRVKVIEDQTLFLKSILKLQSLGKIKPVYADVPNTERFTYTDTKLENLSRSNDLVVPTKSPPGKELVEELETVISVYTLSVSDDFSEVQLFKFTCAYPDTSPALKDRDTHYRALEQLCELGAVIKKIDFRNERPEPEAGRVRYFSVSRNTKVKELETLIVEFEQFARAANANLQELFHVKGSPYLAKNQRLIPKEGAVQIDAVMFSWWFHGAGCRFSFDSILVEFDYHLINDRFQYAGFTEYWLYQFIESHPGASESIKDQTTFAKTFLTLEQLGMIKLSLEAENTFAYIAEKTETSL